ncbi:N/A [soil metagenome]
MRVLIVYGSIFGQTRKVAEFIAERLRAGSATVEVAEAAEAPAPAGFDGVIVASSVRMAAYRPSVVRYVQTHRAVLGGRSAALVSVSMAAANLDHPATARREAARKELDRTLVSFGQKTGWSPVNVCHVAGALPYTRYDFITRWIMKRIAAGQGHDTDTSRDFEYTDWADVASFADAFANAARPTVAHAAG